MLRTGLNLDVLHSFVPLNALSRSRLQDVLNGCRIQSLPAGTVLFRCGDPHVQSIFLLSGRLELTERDGEITLLDATDIAANHALAPTNPRQFNATALSTVNILAVNHQRLYDALLWEQSLSSLAQTLFAELPPDIDRDWVVRLLQSHVFYRVPPMNILALIRAMTPMNVSEGEVIVRQGEQADSCYFIREGRAVVVQHEGRESVTMAYLGKGQYFGEEGLLQDAPRNADVTMLEDGVLMRLEKKDFDGLLKAPSLAAVDFAAGERLVALGKAVWLDVRLPEEYKQGHLREALSLPLQDIRHKAQQLPTDRQYLVYSYSEQRSTAAAFLLGVQGFNASVLAGGLWTLSPEQRQQNLVVE